MEARAVRPGPIRSRCRRRFHSRFGSQGKIPLRKEASPRATAASDKWEPPPPGEAMEGAKAKAPSRKPAPPCHPLPTGGSLENAPAPSTGKCSGRKCGTETERRIAQLQRAGLRISPAPGSASRPRSFPHSPPRAKPKTSASGKPLGPARDGKSENQRGGGAPVATGTVDRIRLPKRVGPWPGKRDTEARPSNAASATATETSVCTLDGNPPGDGRGAANTKQSFFARGAGEGAWVVAVRGMRPTAKDPLCGSAAAARWSPGGPLRGPGSPDPSVATCHHHQPNNHPDDERDDDDSCHRSPASLPEVIRRMPIDPSEPSNCPPRDHRERRSPTRARLHRNHNAGSGPGVRSMLPRLGPRGFFAKPRHPLPHDSTTRGVLADL